MTEDPSEQSQTDEGTIWYDARDGALQLDQLALDEEAIVLGMLRTNGWTIEALDRGMLSITREKSETA
jgi:hypothetical protein